MKLKKKAEPLSKSKRYEDFIKSRDVTLEDILHKYQRALDRAVDYLKDQVGLRVTHAHIGSHELHMLKISMSHLEHYLDKDFDQVERDVSVLLQRMRGTIYGLSHLGATESMVRALGTDHTFDLSRTKIQAVTSKDMRAGGPVEHRAWLGFERLKRKIMDAYQRGILFDETTQEVLARVMDAFPKAKHYIRGPKKLKHPKLTEAEDDGSTAFSLSKKLGESNGIIDSDLWSQMVEDYKNKEIPFYSVRSPVDAEDYYEEHGVYEWEVEKEATQEFVDQVRAGEIDSANENGIIDMMVIAVLDSATDECCAERDGMTISEIEDALDSGELDEDVCEGTVPPFHFNCRCRVVPVSEDLPERMPPDNGGFEEWLDSRK